MGHEILEKTGVFLCKLSPESKIDLQIAGELDVASAEALNPFESTHDTMSPDQLKKWISESPHALLRVVKVGGLQKTAGFVYLYYQPEDTDFARRARMVRLNTGKSSSYPVWELNFWFYPETSDDVVKHGVDLTLAEFFGNRRQETTTVMFADAQDMKEAHEGDLEGLRIVRERRKAEQAFQDTRVLLGLGFSLAGRIFYEKGDRAKDFAYALAR